MASLRHDHANAIAYVTIAMRDRPAVDDHRVIQQVSFQVPVGFEFGTSSTEWNIVFTDFRNSLEKD